MSSKKDPVEDKGFRFPLQIKLNVMIKPLGERHFISLAAILMIVGMLLMARENPDLWEVELFKTLLTAITITGFLNMIMSFHFAANKADEAKVENTAKAFEAIKEATKTVNQDSRSAAATAAAKTAEAAFEEAEKFQAGDTVK